MEPPVILREGAISIEELKRVYNKITIKERGG
jgi:tRNA A37 threonylcarbamoyladenosine synthetase subunit TsaC/SUA5/YrdC